jgi:two-component system phosphate regulon sensor histidine kinase PhoR
MAGELLIAAVAVALAVVAVIVAGRRGRHIAGIEAALQVGPGVDAARAARDAVEAGRRADATARARSNELAQFSELLSAGVMEVDANMVIRRANRRAHVLLGQRSGSLEGRSVVEAFADHRVEALVASARAEGTAHGELVMREEPRATVVLRAAQTPNECVWLVLEDVTELRRLQRIRTEFIDNLSHEIRTPLTNIRLLTEVLARDADEGSLPARVAEGIQRIDVESGHLVQLVNELLDLSRIEQGSAPLHLADVDLAAVARASTDRLRLFASRQGVTFRLDFAPGLPRVRGDEERLAQLLVNLLHNAVKFSPAGGDVTVAGELEGDEVVLSVRDHGVGIPRADLDRVFERFYKVDRARFRGAGGTGLGLSIARHIAESHGGRIWVQSDEGAGSRFSVALPAASGARSGQAPEREPVA